MELIIERVWEAAGGGAVAGYAENRTLHRGLRREYVCVCELGPLLLLLVLHMCHVQYSL